MRGARIRSLGLLMRNAALVPLIQDKAMECKFGSVFLENAKQARGSAGSILGRQPEKGKKNKTYLPIL